MTLLANLPFILVVHPSLNVSSVQELVRVAKSRPGAINYASVGNGSAVHLATELSMSDADIVAKYRALCAGVIGDRRIDASIDALLAIARAPDVAVVVRAAGGE